MRISPAYTLLWSIVHDGLIWWWRLHTRTYDTVQQRIRVRIADNAARSRSRETSYKRMWSNTNTHRILLWIRKLTKWPLVYPIAHHPPYPQWENVPLPLFRTDGSIHSPCSDVSSIQLRHSITVGRRLLDRVHRSCCAFEDFSAMKTPEMICSFSSFYYVYVDMIFVWRACLTYTDLFIVLLDCITIRFDNLYCGCYSRMLHRIDRHLALG